MRKRIPTNVPQDTRERHVMRQWRASGLGEKSLETYITWVRRFRVLFRKEGLDELKRLTLADVMTFAKRYVGARRGKRVKTSTRYVARNALHAWACALRMLGEPVPSWRPPSSPSRRSPVPSRSVDGDFETRYEYGGRLHQGSAIDGKRYQRDAGRRH